MTMQSGYTGVLGFLIVTLLSLPAAAHPHSEDDAQVAKEAASDATMVAQANVEQAPPAVEATVEVAEPQVEVAEPMVETKAEVEVDAEAETAERTWTTSKRNQVFFRGGYSRLTDSRGAEVFTDTGAAAGTNDDKGGFSIAAGLDLALTDPADLNGLVLVGEIFVEYSRYSKKEVAQATSALLGGTATSEVHVAGLNVTVAPMLRYDGWSWVRPFVIPVGLAFLVNSPPSNDTTYLDVGLHFGGGLELVLIDEISLGVDVRYTYAFDQSNTNNSYLSTGLFAGVNF